MSQDNLIKNADINADRFKGFADVYESARPSAPERIVSVVSCYIGGFPQTVVDLGCGTGLSTTIWANVSKTVIGIEPSDDMLAVAKKKETENICFKKAYSDKTGLPDNHADAVICSQSFHWMNPQTTLSEVNRILKSGGVFATVDCDWPPVVGLNAEMAYTRLFQKVKKIESENREINNTFMRWEKSGHLNNISQSGYFRYCRELVFENAEKCGAERFIAIAQSQGSLQTILKIHPELIEDDFSEFCSAVRDCFCGGEADISFCYRMRIGVK